ncbi:MAG: WbqC family protein [Chloroflexota bacterium]
MNVVILQPSYIPWRGYFDQICRADLFVFYDDVQYDKRGWRNRNQIKTAQGKQWLTIPVHSKGAREGIPICDVKIDWGQPWATNHLRSLLHAYGRAPYFRSHQPWLESVYSQRYELLADFTIWLTIEIARKLGITHTRFMRSSEMQGIDGHKTDRLIQILQRVGARHYISGPSARGYVEQEKFEAAGIGLEYMEYNYPDYPQLYPPFDPFVTVLDLLFMVGPDALSYIANPGEERHP